MTNLPKRITPFDDDILRRIAMDIGKQVVAHIEHAYPEMLEAVAAKSAKLSIRNATHNAVMEAVRAADRGQIEQSIKRHETHRRTVKKIRAARSVDELRSVLRTQE